MALELPQHLVGTVLLKQVLKRRLCLRNKNYYMFLRLNIEQIQYCKYTILQLLQYNLIEINKIVGAPECLSTFIDVRLMAHTKLV
jgi:hypothetical protein